MSGIIDCFTHEGFAALKEEFSAKSEGMSEGEQKQLATELVLGEHKKIFDEFNKLRKEANLPEIDYEIPDKVREVEKITNHYNNLIEKKKSELPNNLNPKSNVKESETNTNNEGSKGKEESRPQVINEQGKELLTSGTPTTTGNVVSTKKVLTTKAIDKKIKEAEEFPTDENFTEADKKQYIDELKIEKELLTTKSKENAVQVKSPREVLQREQEKTGKTGSERSGVEPSKQGEKVTEQGKKEKVVSQKEVIDEYLKENDDISQLGKNEPLGLFLKQLLRGKIFLTGASLKKQYSRDPTEFRKRFWMLNKAHSKVKPKSIDEIAEDIHATVNKNEGQGTGEGDTERFNVRDVRNMIEETIHNHDSKLSAFHEYQKLIESAQGKDVVNTFEDEDYANHLILEQEKYDRNYQDAIEYLAENDLNISDEEALKLFEKYNDPETNKLDIDKAYAELPSAILDNLIKYANESANKTTDRQAEDTNGEGAPSSETIKGTEENVPPKEESTITTSEKNILPTTPSSGNEYLNPKLRELEDKFNKAKEARIKAIEDAKQKNEGNVPPLKDILEGLGENNPPDGISHAALAEVRDEFGFGEYEKQAISDAEMAKKAEDEIRSGYNIETLLRKLESGDPASDLETAILGEYKAILDKKVADNPSNENIAELQRFVKASDLSGSIQGRAFRLRRFILPTETSLGDYFIREMEAAQVDTLTDFQKEKVQKEFEEITKAKNELENKLRELEEEKVRKEAEGEVKKERGNRKKSNKSHEDYVSEREKIKQTIAEKWKEAGKSNNMLTSVIVPLPFGKIKQLVTIAPDVKNLMKSFVAEGIDKLDSIIDNIHDILKSDIEGLEKNDIRDILAGVYNEPQKTKSEIYTKINDLKTEAKLLKLIDDLESGKQPTTASGQKIQNQKLKVLRDRIKELKAQVGGEDTSTTEPISEEQKSINRLENQLQDLRDGITKDKKETRELSDREKELKDEIKKEKEKLGLAKQKSEPISEEQKRINKLEKELQDLRDGIIKERKEAVEREISDKEKELKEQIRQEKEKLGIKKSTELKALKEKLETQIKQLENDLRTGNFTEKKESTPIELDKEAIDLKDKYVKLKNERHKRLIQEEYANRTVWEKAKDVVGEILNIPRTIMSSLDFSSAILRQGLIPTVSHPIIAARAIKEMFLQATSQKRFDRWFHDLRETDAYKIMEQSGLYVADPHDLRLSTKEETFMNNLAEKIPIVGQTLKIAGKTIIPGLGLIKASERAYVSYLNKLRVDLFKQGADVLATNGKTFTNSPELYKGLGTFINNATGRGDLKGALEKAAPFLNAGFFAPRLIASRLNMLGVSDLARLLSVGVVSNGFYSNIPKEIRVMAMKDMAKTIGFGLSVLALVKLINGCPDNCKNCKGCATVEADPRSSDFGKIKIDNTRYDIWGGFQQYASFFTKLFLKQKITASDNKVHDLNGKGRGITTQLGLMGSFARGKLAPIPGTAVDYLSGMTQDYQPFSWKTEAQDKLLPLIYSDVKDALKEEGIKSLFTVGLPANFGIGVQTYDATKKSKQPTK